MEDEEGGRKREGERKETDSRRERERDGREEREWRGAVTAVSSPRKTNATEKEGASTVMATRIATAYGGAFVSAARGTRRREGGTMVATTFLRIGTDGHRLRWP